jgi:ubiquinone/menaquinone biosynthesis C-methylase UbiE
VGQSGPILDVCTGTARIPIELCRRYDEMNAATGGRIMSAWGNISVVAVDLADHMLALARRNVEAAALTERITISKADAKRLPFHDDYFGAVLCNGSAHHISDPFSFFAGMHRVCRPGGTIFVRDLLRPPSASSLEGLVKEHAAEANDHQRAMFVASLHASFTLDEVRAAVGSQGYEPETVQQTSDRHWTWSAIRS